MNHPKSMFQLSGVYFKAFSVNQGLVDVVQSTLRRILDSNLSPEIQTI